MADISGTAHEVARYLAERSRPQNIHALMDGMNLSSMHRSTVWRWLKQLQDNGLVEMHGDKKSATWTASDSVRKEVLLEQLNAPLSKRPLVPYQEGFLEEYEPNKTTYISAKALARLHKQCLPGSAEFHSLTPRDQSLFMCGLSYASSSFEGNSYDFIATEKLLMEGLVREGAKPEETTMVLNHHEAVRFLVDHIHFPSRKNDVNVGVNDIKSIHGLLSTNLLRNPEMCGAVRHAPVKINQSSYQPLAVHEAIERALSTICKKAEQIIDPYEQAFFLLVHLPYLQPFEDCNKRTSRLACNIPLLRKGVVPMSWMDVNHIDYNSGLIGVYERNNTSLLAEVFVDGFIHSTERFEIMARAAIPNEIQIRYRSATKALVRSIVLDGAADMPDSVHLNDITAFKAHIEQELDLLRKRNIGALVRNRLEEGDVESWMRENGEIEDEVPPRER
jgi:Fic family protein